MLFSIIINNYNYANYIAEAIESVLKQSYQNFEIIIVDDNSTDNSKEVLQTYSKCQNIKIIFLEENGGQANALNIGVENSNGDAICFLDADDYFHEEKLLTLKSLFENGAQYIHHKHITVQNNKTIANKLKYFPYSGHSDFLVYYLSQYIGNICSTLSISKEVKEHIFPLPYPDEWRIQADDLIVFSSALFTKATFLDSELTYYRIHGKNGYYSKEQSNCDKYKLLKKRNKVKRKVCNDLEIVDLFFNNTYNLKAEISTYNVFDTSLAKLYFKIVWEEMNIPFLNKIKTTLFIIRKVNHLKEKNA